MKYEIIFSKNHSKNNFKMLKVEGQKKSNQAKENLNGKLYKEVLM